jgi:outer membrane immunogenic protein
VTCGFTLPAAAADMPVKAVRPAPEPSWTGCYIGGHAGGAYSETHWTYRNINPYDAPGAGGPILATNNDFKASSWIGGGQIGCNIQYDRVVIGAEGSWSGTDLDQTNLNVVQIFAPSIQTVNTTIKSLGMATVRAGYVVMPSLLAYVKGGYASGRVQTSGQTIPPIPGLNLNWTTSQRHSGHTVGGGLEVLTQDRFTFAMEYDFVRLNSRDHVGAVSGGAIGPANQIVHSVVSDVHAVTLRANYLFGGPGSWQ